MSLKPISSVVVNIKSLTPAMSIVTPISEVLAARDEAVASSLSAAAMASMSSAKASEASASAIAAAESADDSAASAGTATTSAAEAATEKNGAETAKTAAQAAAIIAEGYKDDAAASAATASTAASNAATSEANALTSKTSAAASATTATTKATSATLSQQDAATSRNQAATSATSASTSATAAAGSATAAANSATAAATSATSSSTSATASAASAASAASSSTSATAAKTDAETAKTGAVAAQDSAVASANAAEATSAKAIRDALGKFVGIIPPTLNLFCRDATSDAVPIGTFTRSTGGYRMGPTGLLEWVPAGSIRREWDASGNLLGWLFEETRTNLLTNAKDLSQWSGTGCSGVANAYTAPDGTLTMAKLAEDASNGQHYLTQANPSIGAVTMTASCYAAAGERSVVAGVVSDAISSIIEARFDLSTNTATVSTAMSPWSNVSVKIEVLRDGRRRCILTATKGQGTAAAIIFYTIVGGTSSYLGVSGSGFGLWGAQLEAGAFATSLIPTTSAAVARAADGWTIPTSGFGFNLSEGALFVHAVVAAALPAVNQILTMVDDGTWSNYFTIYRDSTGWLHADLKYGGTLVHLSLGVVANGATIRIAVSFDRTSFNCSLNGAAVVSSASGLPTGMATLRIGSAIGVIQPWNAPVSHLAYFPRRLSNATLQAITA